MINPAPPLVSIVTPVLNGMRYLRGCIDSVLAQEYPRIEHVIIDGGSSDGTVALLTEYAARFPRRIRFVSEADRGCGHAWSKGVRMAAGDVLGCLGADDLCEPGAVAVVAGFFQQHPDAMVVHGGCRQLYDDGTVMMHQAIPYAHRAFVNTARHIATPSSYYRPAVFDRIGPVEECGDDFELMARIGAAFRIHHVDAVLSTLRMTYGTAFNPLDPRKRAAAFRQTFRISRNHGGSLLSPIALRYYWSEAAAQLGIRPSSRLARSVSRAARTLRLLS
jgi:glycosyltransferase involved in cell wall biosynthesis